MGTVIAIVCLGLLIWVEPAFAQKTYFLEVSHHPTIELSDGEVDDILAEASKILKKPGHVSTADNFACDVTLKRRGSVKPFASSDTPAPAEITDALTRDAVHRENSHVKVVKKIKFCRPDFDSPSFDGCAWPPPREGNRQISIIVVPKRDKKLDAILWTHEFAHRKGLWHRSELQSLMTVCADLADDQVRISRDECRCLLRRGRCTTREPEVSCEVRRR